MTHLEIMDEKYRKECDLIHSYRLWEHGSSADHLEESDIRLIREALDNIEGIFKSLEDMGLSEQLDYQAMVVLRCYREIPQFSKQEA